MHELSLCGSIFKIVDRAAEGRPVSAIHLQLGRLRQVVPETLRYCWGLVSEGTSLAGSVLVVESVPVTVVCRGCSAESAVADALVLVCGSCGAATVDVATGEEFLLTSLELQDR